VINVFYLDIVCFVDLISCPVLSYGL